MAKNDFKPFATAANANVMSQADWEALPALLSGFISGPAKSAQVNKAIRQAAFIAASLAQYTANKSGQDVLDDGDVAGFIAKMSTAFGKDFQALDATLTALAGLTTGANKLPYFTGTDTAAQTDLTKIGRDIIGQTTLENLLTYLGLLDVLHKGEGRLLAGTYVSDAEDAKSIGARAATGCQFMRAYKAPDAPDQVNYWQIITMTDVVSPTSQVVVLAITTSTNAFAVGYGTGQGITMWRSIPALEGASFSGNISAPNINAEFQLKAGDAIFRSDGDIYGSIWGTNTRLSGYLNATFPRRTEVDEWLFTKPNRQFITQVGLYQSDKTKPFMLHDDGTGVFLATKDMLSIASLGMTGWHKDNSTGLITQWGEVTTSQAAFRVNFPLAFPNACFGVTVSDRSAFSSVGTSNRTTAGFDLNSSFNGTTNSFYIAKGI
ncbi:hypothetical protein NFJ87_15740 [Citrobacter freundii]|uniref:gp53-like domain-containing protein n=1 Tax=Citrobacter freundii TaxID=546 RepID=UPI00242FFE92|nr:hypothetical protein [Citrobacter freundii]WFW90168.1 hypothetical protein NFJ87_15740 [Citrobacter freundii]